MLLTTSMLAMALTGPGTASPATIALEPTVLTAPQEPDKTKQGKDEKGKDKEKDKEKDAHGAWLTDHKAALEAAKKAKKPVLMVFTGSDWCPPCKKLHAEVFESAAFKQWAEKNVVLLELDFPHNKEVAKEIKEQNEKLAKEFKVDSYPTWIVLDASGKKIHQDGGFGGGSADDWIKKLEKKIKK